MTLFGFLLRVFISAVLAVAGGLKLFSTGRTAVAVRQFGLPRRAALVIAIVLPVVELATAGALLGDRTGRVASVAACGLLASFVAVTAVAVARGRAVSCHCFGNLSASVITGRTVARNVVLLAIAATAGALTSDGIGRAGIPYGRLNGTQWAVVGLSGAVAVVACLFWRTVALLLEQHGRLLLRIDELEGDRPSVAVTPHAGLAPGVTAPTFRLSTLAGLEVDLRDALGREIPVLVVFSDPHCGPCTEIMPTVGHWQAEHANEITTLVVSAGSVRDNLTKAEQFRLTDVLLDSDRAVANEYHIGGTPSAVLLAPDGRVLDSVAGAPAIEQLAGRAISSHAIVQVGRQAPNFALSSLTGDVITEASFATREATLVLFWNPSCGFCQRMQPRLHQWQAQRANGEPPMLIISTGDAAALAGLESLGCPVLLDDGLLTSRFGATGTPMAVVVDSAGVLRSDIAAGEQAILDLLDPLATAHRTALPILTGGVS